jgi:hypothetical protein
VFFLGACFELILTKISVIGKMPDIRNIHHMLYFISEKGECTAQDIIANVFAHMPDVGVVVNRRTAGVHSDGVAIERDEFLNTARFGVVELERHRLDPATKLEE